MTTKKRAKIPVVRDLIGPRPRIRRERKVLRLLSDEMVQPAVPAIPQESTRESLGRRVSICPQYSITINHCPLCGSKKVIDFNSEHSAGLFGCYCNGCNGSFDYRLMVLDYGVGVHSGGGVRFP